MRRLRPAARTVPAAPPAPPPSHLVVRLPNPAGDAVMATPALRALRTALPDAKITWAGRPAGLALLEGLLERDDVFPLVGPFGSGALAPWRTGRAWRRLGADAILCFPNSWSSALAARASGAPTRIGYARRGRGFLLTHGLAQPRGATTASTPSRCASATTASRPSSAPCPTAAPRDSS